jgi:HD-like signal output (HDOD) protein
MPLNLAPKPQFGSEQILKVAAAMGIVGSNAHSGPRLMAALCNPMVTGREVAALVGTDPSICARVLRVANSAYYGQARSIATVERALVLLGLDAVRGIAAAVCLNRTMASGGDSALVNMQALLRHSLATAAASAWLAGLARRAAPSDAFIAGLLHNLGVVVQIHLNPIGVKAMIDARRMDATGGIRRLEFEHAAVGHEECAGIVFDAWRLPEPLVAAVRHHHDPMSAPEVQRDLACLVGLGASLALACGNTYALEPAPAAIDKQAMAQLELEDEQLEDVAAALPARIAELRSAVLDRD